ncbi:transposase [Streptomyces sp. NBC_00233]|uniref:IS110 family transposase n=1 Tax=Streptomyces sp. NBC_00233 TaxID=2975686 RepID=UPI00225212BB|nr:transposase [Streptomyces sp. NBC_00233]MCX5233382.1 IS110 family transposase [Streptomyces sp. NBC_00233]
MREQIRFVRTRQRARLQGPVNRTTGDARVLEPWAGSDVGKAAHQCTVIDTDGTKVPSRRVPNNEAELLELIGDVGP